MTTKSLSTNKRYNDSETIGISLAELLIAIAIVGILSSIGIPNFINQMDRTRQREAVTTVTQAMDLVITTYDEEDNILPNGWNDFRRDFMTDTGVASGATFSEITLPGANYTLSATGGGLEPRYVFTATPTESKASGFNVLGCINVRTGASNIQTGDGTTAAATTDLTCP